MYNYLKGGVLMDVGVFFEQYAEIIIAMLMLAIFFSLARAIIEIVACWRIFTKMGEPGWKALIPIYSQYTMYKRVWKVSFFIISFILYIIHSTFSILNLKLSGNYSTLLVRISENNSVLAMIISLAFSIISIAVTVLYIMYLYRLSRAFGHGVGYTLGLIFFEPIFYLILAFDSSSTYTGNMASVAGASQGRGSYGQDGYNMKGYDQGAYNLNGYDQAGYSQGYNQSGYDPRYNQPGYDRGYNQSGYDQGYDQSGYDQGYNQSGYNQNNNNQDYYNQ